MNLVQDGFRRIYRYIDPELPELMATHREETNSEREPPDPIEVAPRGTSIGTSNDGFSSDDGLRRPGRKPPAYVRHDRSDPDGHYPRQEGASGPIDTLSPLEQVMFAQ
ncbi:hypothetical protein LMH87_000580 [Akanthomyces muscarius]|uniref:Uncharacterized protein n=1 Tax=Akanthomyces muscarius TaxID=2231603 RepID=A0A9W8QGF3_AKAMU|nr:hypothetical protein LMH87_000580 [Akanthomyces muscarius]KAJ4155326.1 hypothetical protein LMH87_000580 [Akanthomyces muscarius]